MLLIQPFLKGYYQGGCTLPGEQLQSQLGRHSFLLLLADALFALSVRDGGMGIPIPLQTSSQTICNPLVEACGEATEGNLMQEHAKNTQHLVEKNSITTIVQ